MEMGSASSVVSPVKAAVAWHDPAQRIDVGVKIVPMIGQVGPGIPHGAQQLRGHECAAGAVSAWKMTKRMSRNPTVVTNTIVIRYTTSSLRPSTLGSTAVDTAVTPYCDAAIVR